MNNPPKEPGYYWLLSASGKHGNRPHYAEVVQVHEGPADSGLVYSRIGRWISRHVTEAPDGAPGWRWGNKIESPL